MAAALPKVTSYVLNLGKSVSYSAKEYLKDISPNAASFIETNEDLFKDIYAGIKDFKGTLRKVDQSIKGSKIYEAYTEGKKALFEDLKTGRFYNEERMGNLDLKASGEDGDWGMDDDFGDALSGFSDDDNWDDIDDGDKAVVGATVKSSAIMSSKIGSAIDESTKANVRVTVRSASHVADTVKASSTALFAQGQKTYAAMTSGMAGIHSEISSIRAFYTEGPMKAHVEASKKFYETITPLLQENNAMMKEMLEMQRNLYKAAGTERKSSQYNDVVNAEGMPDLKEYGKVIQKNLKEFLGPEMDMLFGDAMGKNSNMLLSLVGSPLKFIPDLIVKTLIPITVKKSVETFDKTLGGIFTTVLGRLQLLARNEDAGIFGPLAKIFGLKTDNKTSVDTAKYKKGTVPFDGITRKSIIEVIPGHLARIEAALTNQEERIFDFNRGKWTDIRTVTNEFKKSKKGNIISASYDVRDEIDEYIRTLKKANAREAEELEKRVFKMFQKIYDDKGGFSPYRRIGDEETGDEPYAYYGFDDPKEFKKIVDMMKKSGGMMNLANEMMSARESMSNIFMNAEESNSPISKLFNNSFKVSASGYDPLSKESKTVSYDRNILASSTDEYRKNIFYYLRGIWAELIGMRGSKVKTTSGGADHKVFSRGHDTSIKDPQAYLNKILNKEKDEEDRKKAEKEKKSRENEKPNDIDENGDPFFNPDKFSTEYTEKKELERKKKENKNLSKEQIFVKDLIEANTITEKYKVIKNSVNELLKKPGIMLSGLFTKADKRVYDLLFGTEDGKTLKDKTGRTIKGTMDYIIVRLQETFDELSDWMHEHILDPLKDWFKKTKAYDILQKGKQWAKDKAKPITDALKSQGKGLWSSVKGSLGRTYGAAYNEHIRNPYLIRKRAAADLEDQNDQLIRANAASTSTTTSTAFDQEDGYAQWQMGDNFSGPTTADTEEMNELMSKASADLSASGRFITKRGLTMVSPGEMIIPATFDKKMQNRQLARERSMKSKFFPGLKTGFNATGTVAAPQNKTVDPAAQNKEMQAIKGTIQTVMGEVSGDVPDIIASSLIGGGVSLLTGMVGGPLIGAAVGAAMQITKHSDTVQKALFGEEYKDNEGNTVRKEGLISKKTQDAFKKYFPDIKDFGIAGAAAGLFTPLGLLGGLMAGGAVGYLKNNDAFQNYLFGPADTETGERDGGLISKAFRDKLKKAAPRMLGGAIGGALLGPFGLMGNVLLGSALGFVTTTDTFNNFVFGKDDGHGNKVGGLVQSLKKGFIDPLIRFGTITIRDIAKFGAKHIVDPLKRFVKPMGQMIKNAITGISDHVKDFLSGMFDRTIGRPIADFLQHKVFGSIFKVFTKIAKIPISLGKLALAGPAELLGFIGDNTTMTQIRKGTATNMTAKERLEFRKKHKVRNMSPDRLIRHDKTGNLDKLLAEGFEPGKEGTEKMKELQGELKMYLDVRREVGKQAADATRTAGETISEYLNGTYPVAGAGTLYQNIGYKRVKELHRAVSEGDEKKVIAIVSSFTERGMGQDQVETLLERLLPQVANIKVLRDKAKDSKNYEQSLNRKLSMLTGGQIKDKNSARRFLRNVNTEVDARELADAQAEANKEPTPEEANPLMASMLTKTDDIIGVLQAINTGINLLVNPSATVEEAAQEGEAVVEGDGTGEAPAGETPTGKGKGKGKGKGRRKRGKKKKKKGSSPVQAAMEVPSSDESTAEGATSGEDAAGEDASESTGGILTGSKSEIAKKINEGYHTVQTASGAMGLVDSKGKLVSTSSSQEVKKDMEEKETEKKESKSWRQTLKESLFGKAVTGVKNFLKKAKDGFFGLINNILDNTGIFGKLLKALPVILLGISAGGWLAELWATKIKPMVIDPMVTSIGVWFKENGESIVNSITGFFGEDSIIGKGIQTVKDVFEGKKSVGDVFKDIGKTLFGVFVDGLKKFNQYVLQPFWNWVQPRLATLLYELKYGGKDSNSLHEMMNTASSVSVEDVSYQRTNEKGQLLYTDSKGNIVTSATTNGKENTPLMDITTLTVKEYDKPTSSGVILEKSGKNPVTGNTYTYAVTSAGAISIRSNDTGEYILLPNGKASTRIVYGVLTDDLQSASNRDIAGGAVRGALVGIGATIALGFALASGGILLPLIGMVGIGIAAGAGGAVAGAIAADGIYEISGGGYLKCIEFDIEENKDFTAILLAAFGWSYSKDWPYFIERAASVETDINTGSSYNVSSSSAALNKENPILKSIASSTAPTKPVTNSSGIYKLYSADYNGVYGLSSQNWNDTSYDKQNFQYYREYLTSGNKTAYYDTRTSAYYTLPPEIRKIITESEWKKKYGYNKDPNNTMSYPTNIVGALTNITGKSRFSGKGHVYQNAIGLSNRKFGKSTLGEAGCGPVTAVNMLNRLSGKARDELDYASRFAESGGYIDSSGGTTTDYFKDYFNAAGYGAEETQDKASIANSIKSGYPAVLLGNSKSNSLSTPFGNGNHYINVYGQDNAGNAIVEDPDLPQGTVKYPMKKVLNDTISGVVTGYGRDKALLKSVIKRAGRRKSGKAQTFKIMACTQRGYEITESFESGGKYKAVNKNDGGSMSIGKLQWHGARAKNLLRLILDTLGGKGGLSDKLYNDVYNLDDTTWQKSRSASTSEANEIAALLDTEVGRKCQDMQLLIDYQGYIDTAMNLGLKDENAILYYADLRNQGGNYANAPAKAAATKCNGMGNVDLDTIHSCALVDSVFSKYKTRREKCYSAILATKPVGFSKKTITVDDVASATSVLTPSNGSSSSTTGTVGKMISQIGSAGVDIMKTMYGGLFDALFGSNSSTSTGDVTTGDYTLPISDGGAYPGAAATTAAKQKALVGTLASAVGQFNYSTAGGRQDPDKYTGSCASTMGWAYRKVFGDKENKFASNKMNANAYYQSLDDRFSTVYTSNIDVKGNGTGSINESNLQPGDLLFYRRSGAVKSGYKIGHVEMYMGDGKRIGHGGPNWDDMGPNIKNITAGQKDFVMARRYNGFLSGKGRNKAIIQSTPVDKNYHSKLQRSGGDPYAFESSVEPSSSYSGSSRGRYSGRAASSMNYEQFLVAIVEILSTIANNTKALDQILSILSKSGISIDRTAIQSASGSSRSAKERIRKIVDEANRAAGKARSENPIDRAAGLVDNESTAYIVQVMEALATK